MIAAAVILYVVAALCLLWFVGALGFIQKANREAEHIRAFIGIGMAVGFGSAAAGFCAIASLAWSAAS